MSSKQINFYSIPSEVECISSFLSRKNDVIIFNELRIFNNQIHAETIKEATTGYDTYYITLKSLLKEIIIETYSKNGEPFYRLDAIDSPVIEVTLPYIDYNLKRIFRGRVYYIKDSLIRYKCGEELKSLGDELCKVTKRELKTTNVRGFYYSKNLLDFMKHNPEFKISV